MNELSDILIDLFKESIISITLSDLRDKQLLISKIIIRPIELKENIYFQVSSHFKTKVEHKNITLENTIKFIEQELKNSYKQAIFQTEENDILLLLSKKGKLTVLRKKPTKTLKVFKHDRVKNYRLQEGSPIDFLVALSVMSKDGFVNASKQDKFRQINQFLKIVDESLESLKDRQQLRIVDFGCGSAYLTFALYYYLNKVMGKEVEIIGLDLKEDVIKNCADLALKLDYKNLKFFIGDINDFDTDKKIDAVVTLHACDTATDAALEKAVKWGAEVILSVPCCQHELFKQIKNDSLMPIIQRGILKEKFSSLVTDAARGKILEILGYQVQIIEFIDMEHTPKNILIKAVLKLDKSNKNQYIKEYIEFKNFLNITPSLETRFFNEIFS
jgi:SAM-dependent methyltransferase